MKNLILTIVVFDFDISNKREVILFLSELLLSQNEKKMFIVCLKFKNICNMLPIVFWVAVLIAEL